MRIAALCLIAAPSLLLAQEPGAPSADPLVGTYTGRHWAGPVTLEVQREGEAYVVIDRSSAASSRGDATVDADGALRGEFVYRMLGITRRTPFELRPEDGGLRYRTRGIDVALERYLRTDDDPASRRLFDALNGRRLVRMSSYTSGTSGGFNSKRTIWLCRDGTYRYESSDVTSVYVEGASGSSTSQSGDQGRWRVLTRDGASGVELRSADGSIETYRVELVGDEARVNGERWLFGANDRC